VNRNIVLDKDDLHTRVQYLLQQDRFVFDVETMGENRGLPSENQVVWISFASHGTAFTVPIGHPNGDTLISRATKKLDKETRKFKPIPPVYSDPPAQLRPSQAFDILHPLFFQEPDERPIRKIAHNAPFDLGSVAKYYGGDIPDGPYGDTTVLLWLLNENWRQYKLKPSVKRIYGVDYDKKDTGKNIELHPFSEVGKYSIMDARYTWLIDRDHRPRISEERLDTVFRLEQDLIGTLIDMNLEGAPVDEAALKELRDELTERVIAVEGKIYKAVGRKFNLNAPAQKSEVLFAPKDEGGQGIRPVMLTDGGEKKAKRGEQLKYADYSTKETALERYDHNPVVKNILEYQELTKLLSTYVLGYLGVEGDPKKPCRIVDGRIHADLVQYGTVSGRFSCRTPNLQNIPRPDSELGKKIRGLFIAGDPLTRQVVADYAQIEMFLLAHFAGPGPLYHGILAGMDPHSATAAALAGEDAQVFMDMVRNEDPDAKKFRQVAKGVNFAVVYGAGAGKVGSMAKISHKEAKRFLEIHERQFPEIYDWKDRALDVARSRRPPHLRTLLGRKRRLPELFSKDRDLRSYAERQCINSVIQGSAADVIKMAMIRLNATLDEDMRLILSVHDELVTLCPVEKTERCEGLVKEAMLGDGIQRLINVPLGVDIKTVERWSEAK